jgi:hypothetical protein
MWQVKTEERKEGKEDETEIENPKPCNQYNLSIWYWQLRN